MTPAYDKSNIVSLKKRIYIETELNTVSYKNANAGSIASLYLNDIFVKGGEYKIKSGIYYAIIVRFWLAVLKVFVIKKKALAFEDLFFAHYSSKKKDWNILDDVEQGLKPVTVERFDVSKIVTQYDLNDFANWILVVIPFSRKLQKTLRSLVDKKIVEKRTANVLYHYILSHTLLVENVKSLLEENRPKHILCTHDRNRYCSILMATANGLGIDTSVIIHGSSFHLPSGYVLPIAKTALLWGELQAAIFQSYGLSAERIHLVGFPNMKNPPRIDIQVAKTKFGIPRDKKVLLIASQPYANEGAVFKYVMNELGSLKNWQVVVKLHPTSFVKGIPEEMRQATDAIILPEECSPPEALSLADVVVGLNSTLLIEASSMGKPLVLVDITGVEDRGVGAYFHTNGGAILCQKLGDLKQVIVMYNETEDVEILNFRQQQVFFKQICQYKDQESTGRIVEFIKTKLKIHV